MRPEFDSYDSRGDSQFDSYDSRERRPPPKKTAALGVVSLCFAIASFVGLLGCYGCEYAYVWYRGVPNQGPTPILVVLLFLAFVACGFVSVATALIGIITGVIGMFIGRGSRIFASISFTTLVVWGGGVWWLVNLILQIK